MSLDCTVCGYKARDKFNLSKHLASKKHSIKMTEHHGCSICNRLFKSAFNLRRHNDKFHPKKKTNLDYTEGVTFDEIIENSVYLNYVGKVLFNQLKLEDSDIMDHMSKFDMYLEVNSSDNYQCADCKKGKVCSIHVLRPDHVRDAIADALTSQFSKLTLMALKRFMNDEQIILYKHDGKYYSSEVLMRMVEHSSLKHRMPSISHEYIHAAVVKKYSEFYTKMVKHVNNSKNQYNITNRKH